MNARLTLHHCAHRVAADRLEFVIDLFRLFGCEQVYRHRQDRWVMLEQAGKDVRLQFVEVDQKPQSTKMKKSSHICFLSENPPQEILKLKNLAESKGMRFTQGAWSDREFYIDFPEIFVDFVVEIMHPSILQN